MTSVPAARGVGLVKTYGSGDTLVHALAGVTVEFEAGAFTAIMGPSGSGKSTLMNVMAGLDSATAGEAWIGNTSLLGLKDKGLTALRRDKVGFIFQQFNLLPTLNAQENMTLPLDIAGRRPDPEWMAKIVSSVGLKDRLRHRPDALSGGQQQRVAIARALLGRPAIVFADEPTGNIDSKAGAEVLGLLRQCVREFNQTVVMVTHDPVAAAYADRVIFLADGRLVAEILHPTAENVLDEIKMLEGVPLGPGRSPANRSPAVRASRQEALPPRRVSKSSSRVGAP